MKLSDLIPPNLAFGFTYNKFTFPLTGACILLLIPIVYFPDLHTLIPIMALMFGILYLPIYDKTAVNSQRNSQEKKQE